MLLEWGKRAKRVGVEQLTMPPVRSVASERVLECHTKTERSEIDRGNSGVIDRKGKRGVVLTPETYPHFSLENVMIKQ